MIVLGEDNWGWHKSSRPKNGLKEESVPALSDIELTKGLRLIETIAVPLDFDRGLMAASFILNGFNYIPSDPLQRCNKTLRQFGSPSLQQEFDNTFATRNEAFPWLAVSASFPVQSLARFALAQDLDSTHRPT